MVDPDRPDDPMAIKAHRDRFYGGKALVILGGPSGEKWKQLKDEIDPDVIITSNGNTNTPGAEYWILAENMNYQNRRAKLGDERGKEFMRMVNAINTARFRLISYRSWNLIENKENAIRILRYSRDIDQLDDFSLREYGPGFWWGWMIKNIQAINQRWPTHIGTVALQMIHLAGILGCAEVHTIGFDLMFKSDRHHWYTHPRYKPDFFSTNKMFIQRKYDDEVIETRVDMLETAEYLKACEDLNIFERDSLIWMDHSEGLLQREGLKCANGG